MRNHKEVCKSLLHSLESILISLKLGHINGSFVWFWLFFRGAVSYTSDWSQNHYLGKDGLELLIFCLYSSSAEITGLCRPSLSVRWWGQTQGFPHDIQSHLLKAMQIWVGGKVRRQYKEVSLGQHSQVLLRCCHRHFPRLSVPAPLLFPLSLT